MEIITGYVGKPHVTSEQDRDVHIGMIGSGSYVLQTGKQMAAEISSNNEIKVRDGVLMHQGCAASIKKNTYDSLSIVNGSQGMKRIDLIVARYERNENTGVESLTLKVLKGTPASANPATPAYTTGDIQAGDYIADMPMYKVTLDGINITKLEKMFQTVETNAALTQKVNALNSTCICSLADNVTRTVSLPSGVTHMTALHTYTCKKTGLHIITGNINFSYAYGGVRAYEISFGGSVKNITAQLGYSPDYATYIPVSCAVFLKAGDSISFYAQQNSGNTISTKLEVQIMY